jgi:hypothetical protein
LAWLLSLGHNGGFAGLTKVSLYLQNEVQVGVGELLGRAGLCALI